VLLPRQAALKSFDDDHNGALDEAEFERFAKSLMSTGAPASPAATQQLSCQRTLEHCMGRQQTVCSLANSWDKSSGVAGQRRE
jgi:hypothetical protein